MRPHDAQVRYLLGRVRLAQGDRARALYDLERRCASVRGTTRAQPDETRGPPAALEPLADAPAKEPPP